MRDVFWEDVTIVMFGMILAGIGLTLADLGSDVLPPLEAITLTASGSIIVFFGAYLHFSDYRNPPAELDPALEEDDTRGSAPGQRPRTIVVAKVKCRDCGALNKDGEGTCSSCGSKP